MWPFYADYASALRKLYSTESAVSDWDALQALIKAENVHFGRAEFALRWLELILASATKLLKETQRQADREKAEQAVDALLPKFEKVLPQKHELAAKVSVWTTSADEKRELVRKHALVTSHYYAQLVEILYEVKVYKAKRESYDALSRLADIVATALRGQDLSRLSEAERDDVERAVGFS